MEREKLKDLTVSKNGRLLGDRTVAALLIDKFVSMKRVEENSKALYRRELRNFFEWILRTGRSTETLSEQYIDDYIKGLLDGTATMDPKKRKATPTTANNYLSILKMFFSWAHETTPGFPDIAARVKPQKVSGTIKREPLSESMAGELINIVENEASPRDHAIISLLLTSGLRTIEVVRANVGDRRKRMGENVLYVQGKGHSSKDSFVTLSKNTQKAINEYLKTRKDIKDDDPLFVSESRCNPGERLTTRTISNIARKYLDAIDLKAEKGERTSRYTAHSFRHTFACAILKATGNNFHTTQVLLRHENPSSTRQYVGHLDDELRIETARQHNIDDIYKNAK